MSGGNSEAIITSAVPRTRTLGISDLSRREVVRDVLATPDHLPKIYIYAEKGPTDPILVAPADAVTLYGDKTFDERSIFATHQTVLCNQVFKKGNVVMMQRIIPDDAPPPAAIRIVADVLLTNIPQYERAFDDSYLLDTFGKQYLSPWMVVVIQHLVKVLLWKVLALMVRVILLLFIQLWIFWYLLLVLMVTTRVSEYLFLLMILKH